MGLNLQTYSQSVKNTSWETESVRWKAVILTFYVKTYFTDFLVVKKIDNDDKIFLQLTFTLISFYLVLQIFINSSASYIMPRRSKSL